MTSCSEYNDIAECEQNDCYWCSECDDVFSTVYYPQGGCVDSVEECYIEACAIGCGAQCESDYDCPSYCEGEEYYVGTCGGDCFCNYDPIYCDDQNDCTTDSCDDEQGCIYEAGEQEGPTTYDLELHFADSGCEDTPQGCGCDEEPNPYYNNGFFDITVTAEDQCSPIKTAEYFVGHGGMAMCGLPGTGVTYPFIHPSDDASFDYDNTIEYMEADNVDSDNDGLNWICVQSQNVANTWGNCECVYFESDTIPPEFVTDIYIEDELFPWEYLICDRNPTLSTQVCDTQSDIQGGEFFLDLDMPPLPIPWSGHWMDAHDPYVNGGGRRCATLSAVIDTEELEDGTHYVTIRGKDCVENWGKILQWPYDISFIKDTTPPVTYKELFPAEDLLYRCGQEGAWHYDLTDGCYYVKQGTSIVLTAEDPDPQGTGEFAGNVIIHYIVWWSEDGEDWTMSQQGQSEVDEPVRIVLTEDSYHLVEYWSVDLCGEEEEHHFELDIVDTKFPIVSKEVGTPKVPSRITTYPEGPTDPGYDVIDPAWYITQNTPIELSCEDAEPHPVGGERIYYKYYRDGMLMQDWQEYEGPIYYNEDSWHELYYYCVDDLNNMGPIHYELDMVDTVGPSISKEVGEPKYGNCGSHGYDLDVLPDGEFCYVTDETELTVTAEDPEPHPVGVDEIWCSWDWYDGETRGVMEPFLVEGPFTYTEESNHHLICWAIDALGNQGPLFYEYDIVDITPPTTSWDIIGPSYYEEETRKTYVDGVTEIMLTCQDNYPHPVGERDIKYRYKVNDGEFGEWMLYEGPFSFPEESMHTLEYYCTDLLGNEEQHNTQILYVDHTKPVTTHSYGTPYYTDDVSEWITQQTPITLTADDGDVNHDSGVDETFWRTSLIDDAYCSGELDCQDAEWIGILGDPTGLGIWFTYYEPFTIGEDSCHLIEYYSVDNVEKTEDVKKACVYVDTAAPESEKDVGEPKHMCDKSEFVHYGMPPDGCWYITQETPLTLTCEDTMPHPVGNEKIYWRYYLLGTQVMPDVPAFTEHVGTETTVYITEDSEHVLEWYCEDALGNVEERHFEVDIVDTQPPMTEKEVGEPKVPCGDGEECHYWITQDTGIELDCEDTIPHPVGHVLLHWREYKVGDEPSSWNTEEGGSAEITMDEDCLHRVEWYCEDILGNSEGSEQDPMVEYDQVDSEGPEITKFVRKNGGERVYGVEYYGQEYYEGVPVVPVRNGDQVKFCAEVEDYKETGDPGVGVMEVWGHLWKGYDPEFEMTWDEEEQAYCFEEMVMISELECGRWHFWVEAWDRLENYAETNGLIILIDNMPPMGEVLNPHAGQNYRDGKTFTIYAPAVDFGGDYCSFGCYYGQDCPATGVDYCEFYAIDFDFEAMNQEEIKNCFMDLFTYFEQILEDPEVVYLGRVPYEDGVCKGHVTIPEDSGLTDTVFLGVEYVDKAGNGEGLLQLALNPWLSPISMNIDEEGPGVMITELGNLPGPLTDTSRVRIEAEIEEFGSGFDECWADVYQYDEECFELKELEEEECFEDTGIRLYGIAEDFTKCVVNDQIPSYSGLESGSYQLRVAARDELHNTGFDWADLIIDNTRASMGVVSPLPGDVVGRYMPISIHTQDDSGIAGETVKVRLHELSSGVGNLWCVGGIFCEDTGWVELTYFGGDLYVGSIDLVDAGITGEGTYNFDAVSCDILYVGDEDPDNPLGIDMNMDRNSMHCKQISLNGAHEEPRPECNDGLDNDHDEDSDMEDEGCEAPEDDDEYNLICTDNDEDGFALEGDECGPMDCDDEDYEIHPEADEYCNEVDDNCNGLVDEENAMDCMLFYYDYDQDGYGLGYTILTIEPRCLCSGEGLYTATQGDDCEDENSAVNPGVEEDCENGIDDDCDTYTDEEDEECHSEEE